MVLVLPVLLLVVFPLVFAVRTQRREAALRHGIRAEGQVMAVVHGKNTDYLRVGIAGDCACTVFVTTNHPAAHPVHSMIPVRYDPLHLDRAEALVDRPNPYAPILPLAGGLVLGVLILVPLLWANFRRRRRSLALLSTSAPTMRVRVEAWRRSKNNATVTYLSIYPASSPLGTPPLLCVPTDAKTLARLYQGEAFDLYGDAQPGRPLALRDGEVVIAASAKTRPGSWETANRAPLADVELPAGTSSVADVRTVPAAPLFADAAEARAWQHNSMLVRWLWPALLLLPLIRVLPPRLIVFALPVIGVALVGEYGALWWRRRLLNKMAARLAGTTPTSRLARRAARSAAAARLGGPAAVEEMAALLGVAPGRLRAQQRLGSRLVFGALGLVAVALVALLIFPSAVLGALNSVGRPPRPRVAGAADYTTFTGPLGRPLPAGRPWGRVCQPIRFTVEQSVPDDIYTNLVAVVGAARKGGLDVTLEDRSFMWTPASLYYPPGTTSADVVRVPVFADSAPHPRLSNGQPERLRLGYDAKPDPDGRHEDLTSAQGQLRLAALNGDGQRERTALRQIVALTQGIDRARSSDSGLFTGTSRDGFSDADLAALRQMSGCETPPPAP